MRGMDDAFFWGCFGLRGTKGGGGGIVRLCEMIGIRKLMRVLGFWYVFWRSKYQMSGGGYLKAMGAAC